MKKMRLAALVLVLTLSSCAYKERETVCFKLYMVSGRKTVGCWEITKKAHCEIATHYDVLIPTLYCNDGEDIFGSSDWIPLRGNVSDFEIVSRTPVKLK